MYKISLISMPFSSPEMPSIALTQLKSVTEQRFGDQVEARIHYLSHDFVHFLGPELFATMANAQATNAGLGDWLFRQVAFPDLEENAEEYFARYFPQRDAQAKEQRDLIMAKRSRLERFLERSIAKKKLDRDDLVGFTSMFSQSVASIAMARLLKKKNPRLVTVMGGANCEGPMGRELARQVDQLDFVFSGPGLVSFPRFVEHRMAGEEEKCHQIPGIFSAENWDADFLKGPGSIGRELPIEAPVPLDYDEFLRDLEANFGDKVEPSLTFETSRGCWWGERSHCTFCGLNGGTMAYRAMPTGDALELIRGLLDRYSDRCKSFKSVDNIMPREYLKEVFPEIEPPTGVSFFYEVKADLKEREMAVLAKAGVTDIQPGIESLSTSTLKLMGKGTTSFQNLAFLKSCASFGVVPGWNLLIGFPREEAEVYEKYLADIPLLTHLPPPSGAFPVRFDRFSPYFTLAQSYGLELSPYDFYRYIYPFDDEALMNLAYFFEDRNYAAEYLGHVAAWQARLMEAVESWRALYQADERSGDGTRAMLYLRRRGDAGVVTDTRDGTMKEIQLDALQVQILDALYLKGWPIKSIARQVKIEESQATDAVLQLQSQGLLFEENERYMNVVLDENRRESFSELFPPPRHISPTKEAPRMST